jgi:hypothetical protein
VSSKPDFTNGYDVHWAAGGLDISSAAEQTQASRDNQVDDWCVPRAIHEQAQPHSAFGTILPIEASSLWVRA